MRSYVWRSLRCFVFLTGTLLRFSHNTQSRSEPLKDREYAGSTGPTGPIETIQVTNKEVEELLKPLLVAFENTSSEHYHVQRAKASIVLTKGAKGEGRLSLGIFGMGGEGKHSLLDNHLHLRSSHTDSLHDIHRLSLMTKATQTHTFGWRGRWASLRRPRHLVENGLSQQRYLLS